MWVSILNFLSDLEFRIADKTSDLCAVLFHFCIFWIFPVVLLFIPFKLFPIFGIVFAVFYIYILAGDIFLSVFGHEKLEKKRGMIDITQVQEMRQEIIGALIKYLGAIISFATIFNGLQQVFNGKAFIIANPSHIPYFDLFYFSVVTITTVGYGDIQPANGTAKFFVIFEIVFGLGFALLLFTMLISLYIDIQRKKKYK
ncbi:MAG: two pore domain potassium channel family protein [Candidatus Aminicenantes bacterium]|nr:two pore domain potassium channel family protein [Candidatus Aminicenantes bacterium]